MRLVETYLVPERRGFSARYEKNEAPSPHPQVSETWGGKYSVHLRELEHHLVAEARQIDRQLDDLRQVLPDEPQTLLNQPLHLEEVRRYEDRHG